jgi:hypothetical protein
MEYRRSRPVSLKAHETYNERWLQAQIEEEPGLLGLGDLIVKDSERRQPRAGRLDLLLSDPETHTRYEVEIQLGATDESHIIRTIEYWDIEKSRYPQYEHVAVIVAEDITSRFLNVINLFHKAIPLIAIQLRALDVGGVLTINATTVLDLMQVGTEEEDEPGQATDRDFWINNGSSAFVAVADQILGLINEVTPVITLKYNKRYIGLARDGIVDNFVQFRPRRDSTLVGFRIPRSDEASALVDGSGIDSMEYDKRRGRYRLRLATKDVAAHRDLLLELVRRASKTPSGED